MIPPGPPNGDLFFEEIIPLPGEFEVARAPSKNKFWVREFAVDNSGINF